MIFKQESSWEIELLHTHSTHLTRAENERTHPATAKTESENKRAQIQRNLKKKNEEHNRNTKEIFLFKFK
jgi:hypothetical protein